MSAGLLQVITEHLPNPSDGSSAVQAARINSTVSFQYETTEVGTLSTTNANPTETLRGLLFVPDLDSQDACYNRTASIIPANVTRLSNLPRNQNARVALAPWTSPECTLAFLNAAQAVQPGVLAMLFFQPGNDTGPPPPANDPSWGLGDGEWKSQNQYPVYTIPGAVGAMLMQTSAEYSGNMTDVPYGHQLTETFDSRDYIRLAAVITTDDPPNNLPSLWVFLLIVLGILLAIIGLTSVIMHWLQRQRREGLRRRVASGDVDLEALGIKRLTIPQEILDTMPLYTYGTGAQGKAATLEEAVPNKSLSMDSSLSDPQATSPRRGPVMVRSTSFRPSPLSQPTCAICLDDFVPAVVVDDQEQGQGTIVRELPCHHIFHPECVDTFLRDSSSLCPMCKKSALPRGYCPRVITNAMVRRERVVRRMRERVTPDDELDDGSGGIRRMPTLSNIGQRVRTQTLSGLSQLHVGRRTSSGPVGHTPSVTEMSTSIATPLPRSHSEILDSSRPHVQPPSTPGRREWARQRAVAMLGRRSAPEEDADEQSPPGPAWQKALRRVFPTR